MARDNTIRYAAALVLGLMLAAPLAAAGDDQPKQETTVMYLGKTPITGDRNIFLTLQSIKVALKRPVSTTASEADKVVCRINKSMSDALTYLDCDTNRRLTQQRDAAQLAYVQAVGRAGKPASQAGFDANTQLMQDTTVVFENLIDNQPNHRLHIPVNEGALRKLLDSLPMPPDGKDTDAADAPADDGSGTTLAPAASTHG